MPPDLKQYLWYLMNDDTTYIHSRVLTSDTDKVERRALFKQVLALHNKTPWINVSAYSRIREPNENAFRGLNHENMVIYHDASKRFTNSIFEATQEVWPEFSKETLYTLIPFGDHFGFYCEKPEELKLGLPLIMGRFYILNEKNWGRRNVP